MTGTQRAAAWGAVVVVVAGVGAVPVAAGGLAASENEAPLADAGLDQEVPVNATIHLDATGSRDPDGSIEDYEWEIERPDGTTTSPECGTCARTVFQVKRTGTYNATVTVTDDDGAQRSDTLRVEVYAVEGPSVELSGPTDLSPNASGTFTATAEAGDNSLAGVDWEVNDSKLTRVEMSGETGTDELTRSFEPGTYELSVRVVSELGRTDEATLTVNVTGPPEVGDSGASVVLNDGSGEGQGQEESCLRYNQNNENHPPADGSEYYCDNDRVIGGQTPTLQDADGDGEINFGDMTFTQERMSELASEREDISFDVAAGEAGRLEFESQEAYEEVMGTSYLNPTEDPTWSASDSVRDEDIIGDSESESKPESSSDGQNGTTENSTGDGSSGGGGSSGNNGAPNQSFELA